MVLRIITKTTDSNYPYGSRTALRMCVAFSLVFHVLLLLGFQQAFPLHWAQWKPQSFEVELVRPPTEDLKDEDLSGADTTRLKEEKTPPQEPEEATISLDTKDKRYVSYANLIKQRLQQHWQYPEQAKKFLIEGKLLLVFSLVREGGLTRIHVLESSGHDILDQEAIRAVRASSPFPSFPDEIRARRLHVKTNFDYRLKAKKRAEQ